MEGRARIWRTADDADPQRMVRGVILNLCPGQETTSLLISPEGWLINLFEIEDAEKGLLDERPWCFVKTQFGSVEGHVALVEVLTVLKREFFPDLEVSDEGNYWETRDVARLASQFKLVQSAIDGLAEGLSRHGLSSEAAEDPEILLARIKRVAELVHRTLSRPAEHPPVSWDDAIVPDDGDTDDASRWNALFKENRRRQERVHRAIEEHLADGDTAKDAFDAAMLEETSLGLPEDPETLSEPWAMEDEAESEESWRESQESSSSDEFASDQDDEDEDFDAPLRHPLQQRTTDLMLRLCNLFDSKQKTADSNEDILLQGVGDMAGGLAQAIGVSDRGSYEKDNAASFPSSELRFTVGLSVVQFKRALRGAAFALGALFPLRDSGVFDRPTFDELYKTIEQLQTDIFAELRRFCRESLGE